MTHKPVIYSRHAAQQMRIRRITRQEVQWLLAQGVRSKTRTDAGEQRWKVERNIGRRRLRVVFIERAKEIEIVSAQYRS